ncbi:MAG: DUF433 domain-containing protein [Planctomycetes bacterium]|nr:DUF433 domain-containing protein [Planctomycetota bacterium]
MRPTFLLHAVRENRDPGSLPSYGIAEAAHYLQLPPATLRTWVIGRHYPTRSGKACFRPLISLPRSEAPLLSFVNLVEAHLLAEIRREHLVQLAKVRAALGFVGSVLRSRHPLAEACFETDGLDLFVRKAGSLIVASEEGQVAIRETLEGRLRRIGRDRDGRPLRLYLFTRKGDPSQPKQIVVDPGICFGRPVLAKEGVATSVIAERYKAGDSIASLAEDYGCSTEEIEEAVRCELRLEAA